MEAARRRDCPPGGRRGILIGSPGDIFPGSPRANWRDERGGGNHMSPNKMDFFIASARRRALEDHIWETRGGEGLLPELEAWDRRHRYLLSDSDDSGGDLTGPRYRRRRRRLRDRASDFPTRNRYAGYVSDEDRPFGSDHTSDSYSLSSDEYDSEDEYRHARGRPPRHGRQGPRHRPPVNLRRAVARRPRPPLQDAVPALLQQQEPDTVSVVPDIQFDENGPHGTGRSTVDGRSVLGGGSAHGSIHGSARESAPDRVQGSRLGSARGTARGSRRNEGGSVMDEPRRRPRNGRRR